MKISDARSSIPLAIVTPDKLIFYKKEQDFNFTRKKIYFKVNEHIDLCQKLKKYLKTQLEVFFKIRIKNAFYYYIDIFFLPEKENCYLIFMHT